MPQFRTSALILVNRGDSRCGRDFRSALNEDLRTGSTCFRSGTKPARLARFPAAEGGCAPRSFLIAGCLCATRAIQVVKEPCRIQSGIPRPGANKYRIYAVNMFVNDNYLFYMLLTGKGLEKEALST